MTGKKVEDYLNDGIYGVKKPNQAERDKYLGTLRERIVICLTIGEVMQHHGLVELEEMMRTNPKATLLINGEIAHHFLTDLKGLARKFNISYTTITNEDHKTDIGIVLTYDYAINKEKILLNELIEQKKDEQNEVVGKQSLLGKFKKWFS